MVINFLTSIKFYSFENSFAGVVGACDILAETGSAATAAEAGPDCYYGKTESEIESDANGK